MKKIIRIFVLVLVPFLMVSACTSQPSSSYKPAKDAGYGYTEKILAENYYRVEFKAANSNVKKAEDYALLRAAELTLSKGYDWFEVKKRYSRDREARALDKEFEESEFGSHQKISRECGLIACRTQVNGMSDLGSKTAIPIPEVTALLEISFGIGVRPAKQNIYGALETLDSLRSELSLDK